MHEEENTCISPYSQVEPYPVIVKAFGRLFLLGRRTGNGAGLKSSARLAEA